MTASPLGSNCRASAAVCCLFCCRGCNAKKLRNSFAFCPPMPTYTLEHLQQSGGSGSSTGRRKLTYNSQCLRKLPAYEEAAKVAEVVVLRTSRGERVPVAWLRGDGADLKSGDKNNLVLLYCHGNATDLGMKLGEYFELSQKLGVEVCGVEYSGYGQASGEPNPKNLKADVEAAYDYLIASGVPADHIVVYGQSIGSGPATALAANRKLGGLILHSPMLSGIKVVDPEPDAACAPSCIFSFIDFFPNEAWMHKIRCPAFVIHGQNDDIIPVAHGRKLAEAAPKQHRWPAYFPEEPGHNNIVELTGSTYFEQVGKFLQHVGGSTSMKPAQVAMDSPAPLAGSKVGAPTEPHCTETPAGPEDGRYEKVRGCKSSAGKLCGVAGNFLIT